MNTSPEIIVFACRWHPYSAADNAGVEECRYDPSVKIIGVNCAGAVTEACILRAFRQGAGGVMVAACGLGDCHMINGNSSCREVVEKTRRLLKLSGISGERLGFDLSSETGGTRFAALMNDFSDQVARALNNR